MEQSIPAQIRCYYDMESPRGRLSRGRWPLLIALHGFQGNKDSMMRLARRIGGGKMVVASLQAPHHFWHKTGEKTWDIAVGFSWGTSYKPEESIELHHRNILRLIAVAVKRSRVDPEKVFLLGFSQACAYNYRFVFTYPRKVRGVIAVCGGIPGDWQENSRYKSSQTHVLHMAASDDEWYSPSQNDKFHLQLEERAASVDFRTYKTQHRFPRRAIPHIHSWILKHCRKEE